jgi:hypothetical protein
VRIGPDLCRTSLGGRLPGAKDQQQGEDRCDSGEGRPHYSQVVPAGGVRACVCRVTLSCFQHAVRRPSPASTGGGARWGPAALALSRDAGTGVTRWPTQRRAQGPGAKASVGFELRTADSMPVLYRIPCTATYSATQLRPAWSDAPIRSIHGQNILSMDGCCTLRLRQHDPKSRLRTLRQHSAAVSLLKVPPQRTTVILADAPVLVLSTAQRPQIDRSAPGRL